MATLLNRFDAAFARCPLIAILRGIRPEEVEPIAEVLVEAGFTLIEIPLNSPDPLTSLDRLAAVVGDDIMVGAGTVLRRAQVADVRNASGQMIISPNADLNVIHAAAEAELVSLPGVATPSEAFAALDAGASALKLFPAESFSPAVLRAWRAVLPPETRVLPVGGITPETMKPWVDAGAAGFGLGTSLYKPGMDVQAIKERAAAFMKQLQRDASGGRPLA